MAAEHPAGAVQALPGDVVAEAAEGAGAVLAASRPPPAQPSTQLLLHGLCSVRPSHCAVLGAERAGEARLAGAAAARPTLPTVATGAGGGLGGGGGTGGGAERPRPPGRAATPVRRDTEPAVAAGPTHLQDRQCSAGQTRSPTGLQRPPLSW